MSEGDIKVLLDRIDRMDERLLGVGERLSSMDDADCRRASPA